MCVCVHTAKLAQMHEHTLYSENQFSSDGHNINCTATVRVAAVAAQPCEHLVDLGISTGRCSASARRFVSNYWHPAAFHVAFTAAHTHTEWLEMFMRNGSCSLQTGRTMQQIVNAFVDTRTHTHAEQRARLLCIVCSCTPNKCDIKQA